MIFPGGTWVATSLGWTVVLAAVAAATLEELRSTLEPQTLLPLLFIIIFNPILIVMVR